MVADPKFTFWNLAISWRQILHFFFVLFLQMERPYGRKPKIHFLSLKFTFWFYPMTSKSTFSEISHYIVVVWWCFKKDEKNKIHFWTIWGQRLFSKSFNFSEFWKRKKNFHAKSLASNRPEVNFVFSDFFEKMLYEKME